MNDESQCVVCLVTAPDKATAVTLAEKLVQDRLAACVNLLPGVLSVYRWQDKIESEEETLMVLKTTEAGAGALREAVVKLHPYETPEFLVLPVVDGAADYLAWVGESVS